MTKGQLKSLLTLILMRHLSTRSDTKLDAELLNTVEAAVSADIQADLGLTAPTAPEPPAAP